ncbi:MAG: Ku protein [Labilithrix sp.]|nr:Ku protein [Labilithrix sp.]
MAARREAREEGGRARGASARGIWSGSISFGLLQIPVTLHPAEQRGEEIHFRLLDKHDLSPIRYERVSTATGKPVEWKDIVKGYEIEPESFVVLDKDDLAKANVEKTQTIDIQDFVPRGEIDPAFFDTPYFVLPQKRAVKAYVLLREALEKKGAVAIATFVLRTREHLVALMPAGDAIMLEILRFGHELRDAADMPLPARADGAIGRRELDMAERLVDGMMTSWDPSKYRDRYYADVMKMIEEKAKTGTAKRHHAAAHGEVATDVVDLLELLKKSVARKGGVAGAKPGPKKARRRPKKREAA